jgi:hypothetical protein
MKSGTRLLLLTLLTVLGSGLTAGCASLKRSANEQVVLVQSEPPGAMILVGGEERGQTPRFISLKRSRHSEIELASAEGAKKVELEVHYRWLDSFLPNLALWIFAPIGWGVDLLTGAAWEATAPSAISVKLTKKDAQTFSENSRSKKTAAIAPPLSEMMSLSDTGGIAIEEALAKRGNGENVIPFTNSLPTFLANGYDFDGAPPEESRGQLYHSLGAEKIIESVVEPMDDHFLLKAQERDIYSKEVAPVFELRLEPSGNFDRMYTKKVWWSRLLPNTLGLDWVDSKIQLQRDGKSFDLANSEGGSGLIMAMKYLGALNITSLPPRRFGRSARWTFSLVPVLRVSRRQVSAAGLPTANGADGSEEQYIRWLLSGGYGPEVGWQVSRHYLYLNITPIFYWSQIKWSASQRENSVTNTGLQMGTEAGYILYFNQNWNVKFFSRSQVEDSASWSEALNRRFLTESKDTTVSMLVSGISFGYRFEPDSRVRDGEPASQ